LPGIKVDLKPYENAPDANTVAHALLMADLSENAKKAIQIGIDNPEVLQQVNQRSQMQETSMGGPGRGRRGGGMDFMAGAVASNKTAMLAGLTLGSPDFQRR
jgi:hypothetical protein